MIYKDVITKQVYTVDGLCAKFDIEVRKRNGISIQKDIEKSEKYHSRNPNDALTLALENIKFWWNFV